MGRKAVGAERAERAGEGGASTHPRCFKGSRERGVHIWGLSWGPTLFASGGLCSPDADGRDPVDRGSD